MRLTGHQWLTDTHGDTLGDSRPSGSATTPKRKALTSASERATDARFWARSFCFQTAAIVSRNHGGAWDTRCKLCNAAVDTFAHSMMKCPHLHWAQHLMHDSIARILTQHISDTLEGQGKLPPTMEVHIAMQVDEIWPDCPPDITDFVPDCIIITTKQDSRKHPSPAGDSV
eukprot:1373331-Rhodomonas_salina.1